MEPDHRSTIILSVGHDTHLLSTRHMVLQSVGYIVESTSSIARALKSVREGDFDLVVLCHSLSGVERTYVTESIRQAGSSIPVIALEAANTFPAEHSPDSNATSGTAPAEILHMVDTVLRQNPADIKS